MSEFDEFLDHIYNHTENTGMNSLIHKQYVHHGKSTPFLDLVHAMTGLEEESCRLIIHKGGAYCGKRRCKDPDFMIRDGQHLEAFYRFPLLKEDIDFDPNWILEDNQQYLVANKPSGMPTQGRRDGDSMAFYEILKKGKKGYLGLHHRLDQGTSGLLLFCRNKALNSLFTKLFTEKLIQKNYLAICSGIWPEESDVIEVNAPIGRIGTPRSAPFGITKTGKPAHTTLVRLGSFQDKILVKAIPHTGRTHQIRIHAASIGCPLLGDTLYGGKSDYASFFLHAYSLTWENVSTLRAGSFSAEIPHLWWQVLGHELENQWKEWRSP